MARKIKAETIRSKEWVINHYRRTGQIKVGEIVKSIKLVSKTYEITLEERR